MIKITYDEYDNLLESIKKIEIAVDGSWVPTVVEIEGFLSKHDADIKTVMFMEWLKIQPSFNNPKCKDAKKAINRWLYSHIELEDDEEEEQTGEEIDSTIEDADATSEETDRAVVADLPAV